jgi:hypothetical protein
MPMPSIYFKNQWKAIKYSRKVLKRSPLPPSGPRFPTPPLGYDMTAAAGTFRKRSVLLRRIRRTSARRDILNGGVNADVRRGSTRYSRRR